MVMERLKEAEETEEEVEERRAWIGESGGLAVKRV